MRKVRIIYRAVARVSIIFVAMWFSHLAFSTVTEEEKQAMIRLPAPVTTGTVTVETAIQRRRSVREFTTAALTVQQLSQLLWSAQGVTHHQSGFRTAPSAGATYPLEVYAVVGNVQGLSSGVYRYYPAEHSIRLHSTGDRRSQLAVACLSQSWVREAPASLVITAVYERTTNRYGKRGLQYVHMEVGHAAQNVYLQATAIGLGTVIVGAFNDSAVAECLALPTQEVPLAVLPVGEPARNK
ncbi:MAG: SagB/ThcOx family dehydrogenase [Candidatus Sumerlaeaceae bacterium]|nr:SagB/ThcOx family dehydrogenase [Candidatus Sumerlaeaceae bacterium]